MDSRTYCQRTGPFRLYFINNIKNGISCSNLELSKAGARWQGRSASL